MAKDLRPFEGKQIKNFALTLAGKNFNAWQQPADILEVDDEVYLIVHGTVDPKVGFERTPAGWQRTGSVTIHECFEVDAGAAEVLIKKARAEVIKTLLERGFITEDQVAEFEAA